LKNGTRYAHTARIAKGDPRNPMKRDEVLEKFRSNVKSILSQEPATKLIDAISRLETLDNIRVMAALLAR
jgi:2-methylcitrate dehydratase PrpD